MFVMSSKQRNVASDIDFIKYISTYLFSVKREIH